MGAAARTLAPLRRKSAERVYHKPCPSTCTSDWPRTRTRGFVATEEELHPRLHLRHGSFLLVGSGRRGEGEGGRPVAAISMFCENGRVRLERLPPA